LVVQRTARQWLAVRKTNQLRQERAALVLQSAWRRKKAQINLLYSLVHIILVQSLARRFLAKKQVEGRRKESEKNASVQRRFDVAATKIQKSWRGFWGFSHYVIVQYDITRIQALMRGKLARNAFNLKLGCAILIQATVRRFLSRKAASVKLIERSITVSRALELRERNAVKHIQFWWRIVLDWMKEKKAALIIERFFIFVKKEVDRELLQIEQKQIMKEKSRKKKQKGFKKNFPEEDWLNGPNGFAHELSKKQIRSQSAPRPRPPQKSLPIKNTCEYKGLQNGGDHGFLEYPSDFQSPPDVLHLAPSADFSMVSNITNPSVLNNFSKGFPQPAENIYKEVKARPKNEKSRRLSTEDYIKKYGGLQTAPNSSSHSRSHHFFSEDGKSKDRNRAGSPSHVQGQKKASTPRKRRDHHGKPISLSTKGHDFEMNGKAPPATPRSSTEAGGRGNRSSSRSRRSSSQRLPPVTPTRKKSASILRTATAVTECSTPVENDKVYIPARQSPGKRHGNSVMIMKTNPDFMDDRTIEEAHEIMLLGDDYGEV